jgi:hypothetical protein
MIDARTAAEALDPGHGGFGLFSQRYQTRARVLVRATAMTIQNRRIARLKSALGSGGREVDIGGRHHGSEVEAVRLGMNRW